MKLRLVCRYLADLVAPALFHDLYLYPMDFSMRRLEAISDSPRIAPFVRRLVCMRPQFLESLRFEKEFVRNLDEGWEEYYIRLKKKGVKKPLAQLGHDDYVAGLDDQDEILGTREYVEHGAVLIRKLPNLTALLLSGSDGENWTSERFNPGNGELYRHCSFLQKRYPRIEIRGGFDGENYEDVIPAQQQFISDVLGMLTMADVPLKELSFFSELGLASGLQSSYMSSLWRRYLRLDSLSSLHLKVWTLDPDMDENAEADDGKYHTGGLADLDAVLGRIVHSATSLTDLSVDFGLSWGGGACFRPSNILERAWPCLKHVTFISTNIQPVAVAQFLEHNVSLKKLALRKHDLAAVEWQHMFVIMRTHPSLWMEFADCDIGIDIYGFGRTPKTNFTVVRDPEVVQVPFMWNQRHVKVWGDRHVEIDHVLSDDLSKFLSHEIHWSGSLATVFR